MPGSDPNLPGPRNRVPGWSGSRPARHRQIAQLYAPLIEHCIAEHMALAREANATDLIRPTGWIKVFRTRKIMDEEVRDAEGTRRAFGINFAVLDPKGVAEKEPHIRADLVGGLHWTDPASVSDPHALTLAYVRLFEQHGGDVHRRTADRQGGASSQPAAL